MSEHIVTDEREEILATYNLCLLGPSEPYVPALVAAIVRAGVVETEENLTDLLPDGYRVVVKEWCSDE